MNPFETGQIYNGHRLQHCGVDDRIACVKEFDFAQCRAALALPDLQKTVRVAVERRLRALQRDLNQKLCAVKIGPERGR